MTSSGAAWDCGVVAVTISPFYRMGKKSSNIWLYHYCYFTFLLLLLVILFLVPFFINTLRLRQNGRHFPDDIFKWIFLNENIWISIDISLKFVSKGRINNIPALVQIMAWRWQGDKPFSVTMMVSLLTHICVARPQWVDQFIYLFICIYSFIQSYVHLYAHVMQSWHSCVHQRILLINWNSSGAQKPTWFLAPFVIHIFANPRLILCCLIINMLFLLPRWPFVCCCISAIWVPVLGQVTTVHLRIPH